MTTLLWILLILAIAALVVISSPIRFGIAASFRKSKLSGGGFRVSYIHPALFAYEYSSKGHKERARFFGLNPKWFRWKKRPRKDSGSISDVNTGIYTDKTDGNNGVNTDDNNYSIDDININTNVNDTANNNGANIDSDTDNSNSINDVNTNNTNINNNANKVNNPSTSNDDDSIMTEMIHRMEHIKDDPIYKKTVDKLSDMKSSLSHSYLKDRVFRRKFFKWLKLVLNRALTAVRLEKLKLRATVGFADPAKVGKMYGYFMAAKSALTLRNRAVIMEMEPVFTEKRLEADIELAGRTSAAVIISHTLAVALTFPYLRIRKLMNDKKKRDAKN